MKYYCEMCDRAVDDNGPYERADGDYECQDCVERRLNEYIKDVERRLNEYIKNL